MRRLCLREHLTLPEARSSVAKELPCAVFVGTHFTIYLSFAPDLLRFLKPEFLSSASSRRWSAIHSSPVTLPVHIPCRPLCPAFQGMSPALPPSVPRLPLAASGPPHDVCSVSGLQECIFRLQLFCYSFQVCLLRSTCLKLLNLL